MQELERPGDVGDDPESLIPVQIPAFIAEKRLLQAAIGHVLVDEQLLPPLDAVAEERDDERRPEAGEDLELVLELSLRLHRRRRGGGRRGVEEALDGDGLPVAEDAAEDGARAAAAEGVGLREAVGGGLEVAVGEAAEAEGGGDVVEGGGAGASVEEEGVVEVEEEEDEGEDEEGGGGDDERDEQNPYPRGGEMGSCWEGPGCHFGVLGGGFGELK